MVLYSVKYQTINQKTKKPSGTSGTVISASSVSKARYIFKCSHVDNTKVKYKIISVEEDTERKTEKKKSARKKSGKKKQQQRKPQKRKPLRKPRKKARAKKKKS